MPIYIFKCDECEDERELFRSVRRRNSPCRCEKCKRKMRRCYDKEAAVGQCWSDGFWSTNAGGFPRDYRDACRKQHINPAEKRIINNDGAVMRPNGNIWVKNKASWKNLKKRLGLQEGSTAP